MSKTKGEGFPPVANLPLLFLALFFALLRGAGMAASDIFLFGGVGVGAYNVNYGVPLGARTCVVVVTRHGAGVHGGGRRLSTGNRAVTGSGTPAANVADRATPGAGVIPRKLLASGDSTGCESR